MAEEEKKQGVIYILTNDSFPQWVKIGYANDLEKRLAQLNGSECTPFAFKAYAYYEVDDRLTDLKVHNLIDSLNPTLRSVCWVDGKIRKREFYKMSKEQAYNILQNIASINGLEKNLHLVVKSTEEIDKVDDKTSYNCSSILSEKIKSVFDKFMDKLDEYPDTEVIIKKSYNCLNYKEERIADILFFKNKFTVILNSNKLTDSSRLEELPKSNNWGQMDSQIKVLNQEDADYVLKLLFDSFHFEK